MQLPKHECGLYLEHNVHRDYYENIEEYIKEHEIEFETEEMKARAISFDSLWSLQWYPNTPIGFYKVYAPTLEELLELANNVKE